MELTNIFLDEFYKSKDDNSKNYFRDFNFFSVPTIDKIHIATRLSENSLPNHMNLKNISSGSKMRLLDIGITSNNNIKDIRNYLPKEALDIIENTKRLCRGKHKGAFILPLDEDDTFHFSTFNTIQNLDKIPDYENRVDMKEDFTVLPTEEEFKKSSWELKDKLGIKINAALNQMAVQYGYNSFNAIKPYLNKNKVTNKDRNHKMKMNLSYNQIIENIEILERNSKEYNDHRFSRNKERFIREDTIKNNDELVKLCNDAITYVTGTKTEYKNFKDIDLKVLEAAFLKVFDYTIKLGGINTNYNIIKSIRVDDKVNPNDNDYFVFEFNKDYNSDLLNESERLVQFSKEINKELICGSGKTVDTVIKLLFEKYKLRRGYPFEKVEFDELSHKVEIELENKIKVCYIGTFDKFIINKGAYQITNILINDKELPLI